VLAAAAVCPHPPLLIPEATGKPQPGDGLNAVRAASDAAVAGLLAAAPGLLVAVGAARGGRYRGRLRYAARPHAVSYLIASWDACAYSSPR
jgi:hypothetical protein